MLSHVVTIDVNILWSTFQTPRFFDTWHSVTCHWYHMTRSFWAQRAQDTAVALSARLRPCFGGASAAVPGVSAVDTETLCPWRFPFAIPENLKEKLLLDTFGGIWAVDQTISNVIDIYIYIYIYIFKLFQTELSKEPGVKIHLVLFLC